MTDVPRPHHRSAGLYACLLENETPRLRPVIRRWRAPVLYQKWNSSSCSSLESLPAPTLLSQPYILPVSLRIALFSLSIFSLFALSFPLYSFSLSDLLGFPPPLSRPVLLDQYTPHLLWQLLAVCLLPVSQPGPAPAGERSAAACLCPSRPQGKQLWWALMHYWSLSPLRIYLLMHTRAQLHAHIYTLGPD